jgi:hypothetical protein
MRISASSASDAIAVFVRVLAGPSECRRPRIGREGGLGNRGMDEDVRINKRHLV